MSELFDARLHAGTPEVTALDTRGLAVRTVAYCRDLVDQPAQARITHTQYSALGKASLSADARLSALSTPLANFRYEHSLAGTTLRADSVDAGRSLQLMDAAGRPVWQRDAGETVRRWRYETEKHSLGRLLEILERAQGQATRVRERFVYAANTAQDRARNLIGRCVEHYDPAGLERSLGTSLQGHALGMQRRLLAELDAPSDWGGSGASDWENSLAPQRYTTVWRLDASGQPLSQTDAKGNIQRQYYQRSGQLDRQTLQIRGGDEQDLLSATAYDATGQLSRQVQGNGVVNESTHDPKTHRPIMIKTIRPGSDDPQLLRHLRYSYDPVGNVVMVENRAQPTGFFNNQKVDPISTYTYDSLYQLLRATGRESTMNAAGQFCGGPPLLIPSAGDAGDRSVNYTRTYAYDIGGNLTRIRHRGASLFTTEIVVDDQSNRAVLRQLAATTADVASQFDAAGNQRALLPGQELRWNSRQQLRQVTPISRDKGASDEEQYVYGGNGMRVAKLTTRRAHNVSHQSLVVYLPGLELRSRTAGTTLIESLQEIDAGSAQILHWETGLPSGMSNDATRYDLSSPAGASTLQLDQDAQIISEEEYFPYGGTAWWAARSDVEVRYKTLRYSGKERDATGLYYYGYRYYQPWLGRWLSPDPAGTVDGMNLYRMVRNNPVTLSDSNGLSPFSPYKSLKKEINYIWIGKSILEDQHIRNMQRAGEINPDYKITLWLDVDGAQPEPIPGVTMNILKDSKFFKDFSRTPSFELYQAARKSEETYAVAADVLRYSLINAVGGIYSDIDDRIHQGLGEIKAKKGQVLGGDIMSFPWLTNGKRPSGLSNNFFGGHAQNSALQGVIDESVRRYHANRDGFFAVGATGDEKISSISSITGPDLFTDVLSAKDKKLGLLIASAKRQALDVSSKIEVEKRMPFHGKITVGSDNSWRTNTIADIERMIAARTPNRIIV